ncbi:hypothetical protein GCM10029978_073810 [Actinoallomurus acanthiterrae]
MTTPTQPQPGAPLASTDPIGPLSGFGELADVLAERLYDDAHEGCETTGCHGTPRTHYDAYARELLAVILPVHREQIAHQIETHGLPLVADFVRDAK